MSVSPHDLVAAFDNTGLFHAYGPAIDTNRLFGLFGEFGGEKGRADAFSYLYSAILHQGTPWSATAPVVDLLISCLPLEGAETARSEILSFVMAVGSVQLAADPAADLDVARSELVDALTDLGPQPAARWAEVVASGDEQTYEKAFGERDVANYSYLISLLAICEARPRWAQSIMPLVGDEDASVALDAARAVAACDLSMAPTLIEVLGPRTSTEAPRWERAYAVQVLGELGEDVGRFLADEDIAVRTLAALASSQVESVVADRVLIDALRDPAGLDIAFLDCRLVLEQAPSIAVIPRLVARLGVSGVCTPTELVDVALASARHLEALPGHCAWGRFLSPILQGATHGEPLATEQRRYLAGLVELDPEAMTIWSPNNGSNSLVFRRAGLPRDRDVCRSLVDGAPWPEPDLPVL